MSSLFRPRDKNLFKNIFSFAKKKGVKVYLVGGYLRDIALKREKTNQDIDFCIKKNAISFGRMLSRKIKASFVVLDKEHGCCRLIKKVKDNIYTLDFTDFRGQDIEDDLLHRDFTINAMAVELGQDLLIDPCQGRNDLRFKVIRSVNKKVFDDDPLRILRSFSLSAIFRFKIDKETLKLIILKRNKLANVSYERIRDELFKILETPFAFEYLFRLDTLKILKIIIPEIEVMRGLKQGPYHHLDVWRHSLETLRQVEILIQEVRKNGQIQDYLNERLCQERRRYALIKLTALLHDIGKPKALRRQANKIKFYGHEKIGREITENIARRLKLSNDELSSLKKMVFWHLRPGYLADNEEISPRATFRYFRDTGDEAVSTLLLSIADQRSTKGLLTTRASRIRHERIVFDLIAEYFKIKKQNKPKRLINGNDLIEKFKLTPSPLIGKILSEVEELQAIGKLKTKKEAFRTAKNILLTEG